MFCKHVFHTNRALFWLTANILEILGMKLAEICHFKCTVLRFATEEKGRVLAYIMRVIPDELVS